MQLNAVPNQLRDVVERVVKLLTVMWSRFAMLFTSMFDSHSAGVQTRRQLVKTEPQYGGAACSNNVAEQRECFLSQCDDCDDLSNGPHGLPCFNNGLCVDATPHDGNFTCMCAGNFTGSNCESGTLSINFSSEL